MNGKSNSALRALLLASAGVTCLSWAASASAQAAPPTASATHAQALSEVGEVVVTARGHSETLIGVPDAVTVVTAREIERARADNLTKIGELTPSVMVGTTQNNGGASIGIRGISSPANTIGFEQAVSVAIDGVQTSNGRVGQLGFFDIGQVEILKGPQVLFFGKNSEAGVISVKTAMPTSEFTLTAREAYEFVARESTTGVVISGPLTDTLGGRLALQFKKSDGWLINDARPRPNPFYSPLTPAGAAQLPGAAHHRAGDTDYEGRLTLAYNPIGNFSAVLKIFGEQDRNAGAGVASQVVGCPTPVPVTAGVADPSAECKADNHTSNADLPPVISQSLPRGDASGRAFGKLTAWTASLALKETIGNINLSSLTGYNYIRLNGQFGFDQSAFSQLSIVESATIKEFSQELRLSSSFSGPLNFVVGAYYQKVDNIQYDDLIFSQQVYNAANGRFDSVEFQGEPTGHTYSAFGQLIYNVTDHLELAGGARWTSEHKNVHIANLYGVGPFDVSRKIFPGSTIPNDFKGSFSGSNVSPEATLTWRPDADHTIYAAYKTGYKSGGFILSTLQTSTLPADLGFGTEKVKGGEIGAKGLFLDRRLRLNATVFSYDFQGLQVSTYNAAENKFKINNAGLLRQRGAEFSADLQATQHVNIYASISYVHNRYSGFIGPCYAYKFPVGTTVGSAVPPPNCELVPGAGLLLQQNYNGRAPARAPEFSGNLGGTLIVPVGARQIEFNGEVFYSTSYFGSDNLNPSSYQKSFARVNASAVLEGADDKWRLSLIGRNLTDEYDIRYSSDRTGGSSIAGVVSDSRATVARGREIALQIDASF